jgi:hypothetical protein
MRTYVRVGLDEELPTILRTIGWGKLSDEPHLGSCLLTLEFLMTFEIVEKNRKSFVMFRFSDIHNPSLRFLHRWMSLTLFPMVELHYVATPKLKCLFAMVNRIRYTLVADIVDY